MRQTFLDFIIWLLRMDTAILVVPDIYDLKKQVKPDVYKVEREGKHKGWNGDSKRRICLSRLRNAYPTHPHHDLVLAVELVVRELRSQS